jgi:beta-glucosidase
VQPRGAGAPNRHGLDFYDRLVDAMLQRGIKPCATLYHWDLPQALQNRGGWANRDTCERFRDYAAVMFEQLGDRVTQWVTHNEPRVVTFTGHWLGVIAPGHRDFGEALQVAHHLLLSHGYAVQAFRQAGRPGEIGICQAILPRYPADPASTADAAAARRENEAYNGWFCDPVLDGRYPAELWRWYEAKGITMPEMGPDDLKIIAAPTDFLGINYYTCLHVRHDKTAWPLEGAYVPQGRDRIETGGEIWPEKLQDTLLQFHARYPSLKLRILENGACVKDVVNRFGQVEDEARIDYIHRHLVAIHGAISAGVKIDAYYVWSLMDNFEWSHGHAIRFGLIHVDYPTQQRRVKASGRWYGDVIRHNGVGRF